MDNGSVHERGYANPCEDFVHAFAEHSSPFAARSRALASLEICFNPGERPDAYGDGNASAADTVPVPLNIPRNVG
jgi:hypothetical protein